MRKLFGKLTVACAVIAALVASGGQANAGHITSTDGNINGVPLATYLAFPNPTITVTAGAPIDVHFGVYGVATTFQLNFSDHSHLTTFFKKLLSFFRFKL